MSERMLKMNKTEIKRQITLFDRSTCTEQEYRDFLVTSYGLMKDCGNYFAPDEDINSLELAHLVPEVPETVLAIYVGINDAACNKGLVTPLLPQHGHNNVFAFDPQVYLVGVPFRQELSMPRRCFLVLSRQIPHGILTGHM